MLKQYLLFPGSIEVTERILLRVANPMNRFAAQG